MRCGLVAQKLGMTRIFDNNGFHLPITLFVVEGCRVLAQKTSENSGYNALQVGGGTTSMARLSKPLQGFFKKISQQPCKKRVEFLVSPDHFLDVGFELSPDHFQKDQWVDVTGISIGKGFAGSMKRHNFGGTRASHGASISHRSHGSTGQCQDPGRVFKGKKMAGQMGNKRVTVQNLKIVDVRPEENLILVKGCVPGPRGGYVMIRDAIKKHALVKKFIR